MTHRPMPFSVPNDEMDERYTGINARGEGSKAPVGVLEWTQGLNKVLTENSVVELTCNKPDRNSKRRKTT